MMKRVFLCALALLLVFSLVACGNGGNGRKDDKASAMKDAAGTYEGTYAKFVGDENPADDEPPFSLELKEDGTASSTRDGETYNATWKLDGEKFTMEETFIGVTISYTGTLKDGKLDIFNGDPEDDFTYEYVYEKQ